MNWYMAARAGRMNMHNLVNLARFVFAAALAAFGVQHFVYAGYRAGLGPPWIAGSPLWTGFVGTVLVLAGISIAAKRQARLASILLAAGLLLYFLAFYVPRLVARIHDPGPWTSGFEILAISGAALVLAGSMPTEGSSVLRAGNATAAARTLGRFLFAMLLVVVGTQHFLYAAFVATLVPSWIPAGLFWAYFVGAAFLAAALSIATTIKLHLAATLLGVMFCLWVFIVHLPRVVGAAHNGNEWTSLFVALAMCGGAWIVAGRGWKNAIISQ